MKKLLSIFAIATIFASAASAQVYSKPYSGRAQDTIHKSTTILSPSVNLINSDGVKCLVLQVATDSVSGTPDTKYVLQRSTDNVHFYSIAGDTLAPVYIGVNAVHPSVSANLTVNPYSFAYARVKIYTGAGTQKSKTYVTFFGIKAGVK